MTDITGDDLTPEDKASAREIFSGSVKDPQGRQVEACYFCGGLHDRVAGLDPDRQPCPRIKRLERHVDGTLLSVEFWAPGRWESGIVFPRDVYDEEADANG
jgi:hypothetical protein